MSARKNDGRLSMSGPRRSVQTNNCNNLRQFRLLLLLHLLVLGAFVGGANGALRSSNQDIEHHPNWPRDTMAECGVSATDRIVGGKNATLGQYPWLARIGIRIHGDLKYDCGGSLVSKRHVLSAAHCITNLGIGNQAETVILGEHNARTAIDCEDDVCADPPQLRRIAHIAYPPNYNRPAYAHDLAVIQLQSPVIISEWVLPVCLPFGEVLHTVLLHQMAEVAGWGLTDSDDTVGTDFLQTLRVPVLPMQTCSALFGSAIQVSDQRQMCVGGRIGEDSCSGDSGGPLVSAQNSRSLGGPHYFQFGIVSIGSKDCGETATPALYTNVRYYLRWIVNQMV